MSRSNSATDDSLDLLLDTICNTFGGVLFISMLVVILLNMSSESISVEVVPEVSHQQMLDAQTALAESRTELERLRRAAHQKARILRKFENPELVNQLSELQAVSAVHDSMTQNRDTVLNELTSSQEAINDAVKQMQQLKSAQEQLSSALAEIEAEVQSEIVLRSRTAELPKQRLTQKKPIAFLMKNGKLYSFAKKIDNGQRIVNNEAEVKLINEGGKTYAEPIDSAGLPIDLQTEDLSPIETKLKEFDSQEFFISIVVWTDSFSQFMKVKEAMVRNQYEYQLVPWSGRERLPVGSETQQNIETQ